MRSDHGYIYGIYGTVDEVCVIVYSEPINTVHRNARVWPLVYIVYTHRVEPWIKCNDLVTYFVSRPVSPLHF